VEKIMANFGFESTTDDVLAGQDLSGKTAVVTGGASGVGWETARALAVAGAHVVTTARNATKWAANAPELDGKGGLYIQDCGIAPPSTPEVTGAKPYALDPAAAARLWEISERMVGETFALS